MLLFQSGEPGSTPGRGAFGSFRGHARTSTAPDCRHVSTTWTPWARGTALCADSVFAVTQGEADALNVELEGSSPSAAALVSPAGVVGYGKARCEGCGLVMGQGRERSQTKKRAPVGLMGTSR